MEFDIHKIVEEMVIEFKETEEGFIFTHLQPYCENVLEMKIDKKELKRILLNGIQKQQPCGDCISREAVIEWIDKSVAQYGGTYTHDMLTMWGLFKDWISRMPSVKPKTRWIPVSEKLPKEEGQYLVSTCQNCIDTCFFYNDDGDLWVDYEDSVIAWMPLPQPYKEGEE